MPISPNLKCLFVLALVSVRLIAADPALIARAKQGDADAQRILGMVYFNGDGVEKNPTEAVKWMRKAAAQENSQAQFVLGMAYFYGNGVERNGTEAVNWWLKAAEHEHAGAQSNVGMAYYDGTGVEPDYDKALKWLLKGAAGGDAEAQRYLGKAYSAGNGVEKDSVEAVKWWRKAAEQGDAQAQIRLGSAFYLGEGVAKDRSEAVRWLSKAAEQGDEEAQRRLNDIKAEPSRKVIHREKPEGALAVKGLFLGMDIEDAVSRIKSILPETNKNGEKARVGEVFKDESGDEYHLIFGATIIGAMSRIDANSAGEVTSIYLDGMTVDSIFGADKMTPKEFASQFAQAYNIGAMPIVKYDKLLLNSNVTFNGWRCTRPDGVRVTIGAQFWSDKDGWTDTKTVEIERVMNKEELKTKFN